MTNEEAKRILCSVNCNGGRSKNRVAEALDLAISALEKQIPKKPIIDVPENDNKGIYFRCQKCNEIHNRIDIGCPNFCPECGQAINWSDEE